MIVPGFQRKAQAKGPAKKKRGLGESFTSHAVKLQCHYCVWEEVEELLTKKDLEEAIQIEQLFKLVPERMFPYTSGCREASLFETAKWLDKVISEIFCGNCLIDEKKIKRCACEI